MNQLKAIWAYRFFILSSIKTDFKSRFVRSKLGGIWMVLNPLAQVAIYALVLSAVLKAKLPNIDNQYAYAIYLMAGTLGWNLFSEVFVTGSALVNNILLFGAILVVFGLLGHMPTLQLLWLPLLMVIILALGLGLGLMLGVINVFVRDIGQIVPILLQFWFWLTPVVYVANALPENYRRFFYYNPMTGIIEGFQNIMVYNKPIEFDMLIYPVVLACVSLSLALFMYVRANEEMADAL